MFKFNIVKAIEILDKECPFENYWANPTKENRRILCACRLNHILWNLENPSIAWERYNQLLPELEELDILKEAWLFAAVGSVINISFTEIFHLAKAEDLLQKVVKANHEAVDAQLDSSLLLQRGYQEFKNSGDDTLIWRAFLQELNDNSWLGFGEDNPIFTKGVWREGFPYWGEGLDIPDNWFKIPDGLIYR